MSKAIVKKILEHPDKDEIIGKLLIGIESKDIVEWLESKYDAVNNKKFIIGESSLKKFQSEYLDIYSLIQEDLAKSKQALANGTDEQLALSLQNNQAYKAIMVQAANSELDIRKMLQASAVAIETRLGQIYDIIMQDPTSINTRVDRVLIEYIKVFSDLLDKYHKIIEAPQPMSIENNFNIQVSEHIMVFYDIIKEILTKLDTQASLYFMDRFQSAMSKIKAPDKEIAPTEVRLAEAKLLSETINQKLNG